MCASQTDPSVEATLDPLVARVLETYGYTFTVAGTPAEREAGYRIRHRAAAAAGWTSAEDDVAGLERDRYDEFATHIVGWLDAEPVSTGRLVLPPGPLPTEDVSGLTIEPRGQVVDVGRMAVVPEHQSHRHGAFIALMCRLYLEMREQGYAVACGMMATSTRRLVRLLGLQLELLGDDRDYWHEQRAPVRFTLTANVSTLPGRWAD